MSSNMVKVLLIAIIIGGIVFVYFNSKRVNKQGLSDQDFKKIMNNLLLEEDKLRFEAIDQIKEFKPNKTQSLFMIQSAKNQYPKAKYEWQNISAILIDVATEKPDVDYISEIQNVFSALNSDAKTSALMFLQKYDKKESIVTYIELISKHYIELSSLPIFELEKNPKYEEIIFPQLLYCTDNEKITYDIYLLALKYLDTGLITVNKEDKFINQVLSECKNNRKKIESIQGPKDKRDWIWDMEDYLELRYKQEIILDLLGFIDNQTSIEEQKRGLNFNDNRLKYFSILSLLKHDIEVSMIETELVASDLETRNLLYDGLKKINRLDLFPQQYKNQAAFAESNMVNWLIYPTELGRVLDEIELMKVVSEDTKTADGVIEFYLFRFRSNHPDWVESGWMVGLAGPFITKGGPNTDAYGYTFSSFEKWEGRCYNFG